MTGRYEDASRTYDISPEKQRFLMLILSGGTDSNFGAHRPRRRVEESARAGLGRQIAVARK